jgi:hypothetical protein
MDTYVALTAQDERDLDSIAELLDLGSWPAIAGASDTEPTNPIEAVTLGLTLALTAPTDEKAQACAALAEDIAASAGLTAEQLEQCKDDACKHAFSD